MRPRKFDELANCLEKDILSGSLKPGEPIPSQNQLCEAHGVSRSCVQKALDELIGKGLLESRPGKGVYVRGNEPAAEPKRRFKNVAVVFHQEFRLESDPSDNFGLEMLWGVEEELRKANANCIIRKRSRTESFDRIVPELEAIEADAFILDREFNDEQLRPLRALGVPVAVLGRLSALPFVSSSLPNHADSFLKLFSRIASEGRRSVALVHDGNHYYDPEMLWAVERAKALCKDTAFINIEMCCPLRKGDGIPGAMEQLIENGLPEVIAFANDWHAVSALNILASKGIKVPDEVSVIGCYNLNICATSSPSLSSMALDARELGRRAVRMLADSALNGAKPSIEKVAFSLVERASFKWKEQGEAL